MLTQHAHITMHGMVAYGMVAYGMAWDCCACMWCDESGPQVHDDMENVACFTCEANNIELGDKAMRRCEMPCHAMPPV